MLILAIDTSTRSGSVALLRDHQVLDQVSGLDETPYSSRLFSDLAVLQNRACLRMDQVDLYAVVSGPGSFTGLRVGLTAVKAWAEIFGKPIAAISGLEAIAAQSKVFNSVSSENQGILWPFVDARRAQLYSSGYRSTLGTISSMERICEESVLSAPEFLIGVRENLSLGTPVLISPTPDVLPKSLVEQLLPGIQIEKASGILAPVVGQLGFARAVHGDLVDALRLDANYVRRSDAEAAWKDRQ